MNYPESVNDDLLLKPKKYRTYFTTFVQKNKSILYYE